MKKIIYTIVLSLIIAPSFGVSTYAARKAPKEDKAKTAERERLRRVDELNVERKELKAKADDKKEEVRTFSDEFKTSEDELKAARNELNQVKKKLGARANTPDRMDEREREELENAKVNLNEVVYPIRNAFRNLGKQYSLVRNEHEDLQKRNEELSKTNDKLQTTIQDLKTKNTFRLRIPLFRNTHKFIYSS